MPAICGFFYGVRKMPLPNILEFIGTNISQRKFQEAQEKLLNYLGIEVPTKTELNSEISKVNNAITSKADKAYVDSSLTAIAGGHKAYATLAAALANTSTFPQNSIVEITNDGANNGTYQWNGADLTKSAYDPLAQAKSFTTTIKDTIVFDNAVGDWVATNYTSRFTAGKRLFPTGVISASGTHNFTTDFIPVKRGMKFTLVSVAATPEFANFVLYDNNKIKLSHGAPTTSHSPHIARTIEIVVAQDGYLVAWTSTEYIATYSLQLNAPSVLYVSPNQVKSIESAPESANDVLSLESAKALVNSSLTKKTYAADCLTKIAIEPLVALYQETQGATNANVKPILSNGKLTYSGEFLPGIVSAFRLMLGFYIENITSMQSADRGFTLMIKGRAKGTNFNLKQAIPRKHGVTVVTGISNDSWTEFDLMIQSDYRNNLQNADKQWSLYISAIDSAIKADVQLEFDHLMLIETQENFVKSDYLSIVNNKTIYIANQTLPHVSRGNWFGKKMVTIGHSLVFQNQWQDLLAQLIGANYSVVDTRGTSTKQPLALGGSYLRAVYQVDMDWSFDLEPSQSYKKRGATIYTRADFVAQHKPDLIIVFNPNNDMFAPEIVGETSDIAHTGDEVLVTSDTDPSGPTVISSLKGIFKKLGEQNPKAKIVFCSDILNGFAFNNPTSALTKMSRADLVSRHNKIKTVCEMYGVQFIDLLHNTWNVYEASSYFIPTDTTHPNSDGGEKIARYIASQL